MKYASPLPGLPVWHPRRKQDVRVKQDERMPYVCILCGDAIEQTGVDAWSVMFSAGWRDTVFW